jgi:hypothetical protein
MLAIKPQCGLKDARQYFKRHLSVDDYYTEGQHVPGHWFGQGAEDLGLTGVTHMDEFVRLCENLHPQPGEKLTMRQNTTRTDIGRDGQEHENSNRRVFYDFTFSPAKSVSIAALMGDDPRISQALRSARPRPEFEDGSAPTRNASSGMEPPPQNGSTTSGRVPGPPPSASCAACVSARLVSRYSRTVELSQLAKSAMKSRSAPRNWAGSSNSFGFRRAASNRLQLSALRSFCRSWETGPAAESPHELNPAFLGFAKRP